MSATPAHPLGLFLQGIHKRYQLARHPISILENINLQISAGENCAVLGTSGSGKSTLLNILGLLDRADEGRYEFYGHDTSKATPDQLAVLRNRHLGFIYQNFNLMPRLSALDNIALPLSYRGIGRREALQRAMHRLHQVGLGHRAHHLPADLSGGQRQRVAIARALVGEPSLILADEPTGNLDNRTANDILDLLLAINREHHVTLIIVTHDLTIAERLDRQICVQDRTVRELAPCQS
ncbi:ABC transporter ATP-binding protein [Pseudomonas fluorescens]|uniref:ABC transporter ATP-binding protein n=1 Tax=Pseudomonas fluorescens TaxID=294 RepID=UPI000937B608|nr:ABC transporter ATP-binding protein [Pseudomonas fluorescens]